MSNWLLRIFFSLLLTYGSGDDSSGILECISNDECAADRACVKHRCEDPCDGVCGPHTVCQVTNHVSMCSCSPGHSGHPIIGCSAYPDVAKSSGCKGHDHCPASKVCVQGKCEDPCDGLCGDNTTCTVRHHIPACACKDGYTGNPFLACFKQHMFQPADTMTVSGTLPPDSHGKKTFYLSSREADWNEAFTSCLKNNSTLASVDSMEEMENIRRLIIVSGNMSVPYWTSGSDHGSPGLYVWASSGKRLPTTSDLWLSDPPQPDNTANNEHCLEVIYSMDVNQGFRLNDRPCGYKTHFICEYYI